MLNIITRILFFFINILPILSQPISPAPFVPFVTRTNAGVNWIELEWSDPIGPSVSSYNIMHIYSFKGCKDSPSHQVTSGKVNIGNVRSYNITNVEENSKYTIILEAVNADGMSSTNIPIETLPTAPTRTVNNLAVILSTDTTINITWNRIACQFRNSDIKNYVVIWYPFIDSSNINDATISVIMATNNYQITNLIPRTRYYIGIRPDSSNQITGPLATINGLTLPSQEPGVFSNGQIYSNNSVLPLSQIGSRTRGLMCLTNLLKCCSTDETEFVPLGSWTLPNGFIAPSSGSTLFVSRGPSFVTLNKKDFVELPAGIYTCEIPNILNMPIKILVYAHFYSIPPGAPVITSLRYDNLRFTMYCLSSGQLVDSVTWLKDGQIITSSGLYVQTQRIVDREEVVYENQLRSTSDFQGHYTCIVTDGYGRSTEKNLTLNITSIYIQYCLRGQMELSISLAQVIENRTVQALTVCSSKFRDSFLRDKTFRFGENSGIFTVDLVGIPDMKRMEVIQCLTVNIGAFSQTLSLSVAALCTTRNCQIQECEDTFKPTSNVVKNLSGISVDTLPTPPISASIHFVGFGIVTYSVMCYLLIVLYNFME